MRARFLSRPQPLILAALVLLLLLLAVLQYRWIGQVSRLEGQRMHALLSSAGARFSEDFDREVTRAFLYFHPDPQDEVRERTIRQADRWLAEAPYPNLVRDLFLVQRGENGDGDLGDLRIETLVPGETAFRPVVWPAELQGLRRELAEESTSRVPLRVVTPDLPGLVIPANWPTRLHRGLAMSPDPAGPPDREYLILRLDSQVLAEEFFPDLTRRHFAGPRGLDFTVAVVSADDPDRLIFRSDPKIPAAAFRSGDVEQGMFGLRPFDELRSFWRGRELWGRRRGGAGGEIVHGHPPLNRQRDRMAHLHDLFRRRDANPPQRDRSPWRLVVKHREGSLEAAVARVRRHNLGMGAGILVLLGTTAVLMVVSTQRAQALARQQIDFVAGVSHELRTPITAIRSAGQNLADGVVADPVQVRRYGNLILSEGRRLSQRVEQVLEFASLRSDRKPDLQPTRVEDALDAALDDCRWLLEERGAEVEEDIPANLPAVQGDPGGLRRALRNLIENAAKYGGPSPWIGLRARATGREVEVTVEDRGPGILREDLPHLFEPFYRGWRGRGGEVGVPGSGLGLSIVQHVAEAHAGRVSVGPGQDGRGSAFTLHIPLAPAQTAPGRASLGEAGYPVSR
ncbi:MAG TPA: HAMP domain-containing sensor histidine kinase [Thermoanaerobaculia bacterium]|nr:HAMP domain-containing sensor histidine kinase [Thermoanaerobaculia bacterium]